MLDPAEATVVVGVVVTFAATSPRPLIVFPKAVLADAIADMLPEVNAFIKLAADAATFKSLLPVRALAAEAMPA